MIRQFIEKRRAPKTAEAVSTIVDEYRSLVVPDLRDTAEPLLELLEEAGLHLLERQPLRSETDKLKLIVRRISLVLTAFQAGFSPITPNKEWFCGVIRDERVGWWRFNDRVRKFTHANPGDDMLVFSGHIPAEAQERIVLAETIFEHRMLISSPNLSDFSVPSLHMDPVAIGLIENVPEIGDMFFEIIRWDTQKDLQALGD